MEYKDYSEQELIDIFKLKLEKSKLKMEDSVIDKIANIINLAKINDNFGNGRFIDKLFKRIVMDHANNTYTSDSLDRLTTITEEDIGDDLFERIIYNAKIKTIGFKQM